MESVQSHRLSPNRVPLFLHGDTVMPTTTSQPVIAAANHHERHSHCSWKDVTAARPAISARVQEMLTMLNRALDDAATRETPSSSETVWS
jgi:hypothetical protein